MALLGRFIAAGVILWVTYRLVPGISLGAIDLVILPVILALLDGVVAFLFGRNMTSQNPGFPGWALSILLLYGSGRVLPHAHLSPQSAFVVGTLFWLSGWITPMIFG